MCKRIFKKNCSNQLEMRVFDSFIGVICTSVIQSMLYSLDDKAAGKQNQASLRQKRL